MATATAEEVLPPVADYPATYKIIRGSDMIDLATAVNRAMQRGWTPVGGVVFVPTDPMQIAQTVGQQPLPFWQSLVRTVDPEV
jgi:hypothetical protein